MGSNEFYWVLPSFPKFHRALTCCTGFYRVLLDSTEFYWVLPSFRGKAIAGGCSFFCSCGHFPTFRVLRLSSSYFFTGFLFHGFFFLKFKLSLPSRRVRRYPANCAQLRSSEHLRHNSKKNSVKPPKRATGPKEREREREQKKNKFRVGFLNQAQKMLFFF